MFFINLSISVYSIILLTVILVFLKLRKKGEDNKASRYYFLLIIWSMIEILLDLLSRYYNKQSGYFTVIRICDFLSILFQPLICGLWHLYVCNSLNIEEKDKKTSLIIQSSLTGLNAVLLILNQFFHFLYYYDENNSYVRGKGWTVFSIILLLMIFLTEYYVFSYRKRVSMVFYRCMILFPVFPYLCILAQNIFQGLALGIHGVVLSLSAVFMYSQNDDLSIDYLTGLYNRRKFEVYLDRKISKLKNGSAFSVITMDINSFKRINDVFGHQKGDQALIDASMLLRKIIPKGAFVARTGGDEFYIIMDTSDKEELDKVVDSLNKVYVEYSFGTDNKCFLSFSIGYGVYDFQTKDKKKFLAALDFQMYEDKRKKAIVKNSTLS